MRGPSSWGFTVLNSKKIGDISLLGKSQVQGHHTQWHRLCTAQLWGSWHRDRNVKHIPKCCVQWFRLIVRG